MPSESKRDCNVAQLYLYNFASRGTKRLMYYDCMEAQWRPRMPKDIHWGKELNATEEKNRYWNGRIGRSMENEAITGMRKAMAAPATLAPSDLRTIARFLVLNIVGRPPAFDSALAQHLQGTDSKQERQLDLTEAPNGVAHTESIDVGESLKASRSEAEAVDGVAGKKMRTKDWILLRTTIDKPFVVSDWPIHARPDGQMSFPISSETAAVLITPPNVFDRTNPGGRLILCDLRTFPEPDWDTAVLRVNHMTMANATKFVACRRRRFLGMELLTASSTA